MQAGEGQQPLRQRPTAARCFGDRLEQLDLVRVAGDLLQHHLGAARNHQKQVVEILDHFDILCNDLTTGLPAEIEARQKQYEYYRDKLLTFKELGA